MVDQFNILDYTDGPLLKTGQTIEYTPAGRTTKDDGGFQRGIKGSLADAQYTILTNGQYSGITNITVNGFTDAHTNACVFDKVTSLFWNREQTPALYGTGAEELFWDDTAGNNEDIFEYCDQANITNLSGFADWRVPNVIELFSLYIRDIGPATPNSTAFPIWSNGDLWCSTTRSTDVNSGMVLRSTGGADIATRSKTGTRLGTILVRLGIE